MAEAYKGVDGNGIDVVVNFAAESEGITTDTIIDRLLASTPTKEDELLNDARFKTIFAS